MKSIAMLSIGLLLAACSGASKEQNDEVTTSLDEPAEVINTINLSRFEQSEFPEEIDGCACYYKEKGKEDEGYIYVDDFSKVAFIKIGDTFEALEIYEANDADGVVKHKCRAEHYGLQLDLKEVGHEDETWQYEGIMSIDKIDGSKMEIQVVGECGC